jgi:deoxyribonuclease II
LTSANKVEKSRQMQLSAIDDQGRPVDWWFMYKVAGKSKASDGRSPAVVDGNVVTGTEYVYFDSNENVQGKLALSRDYVDRDGALPNTLEQLYGEEGASTLNLGWFFYNDENPITGKNNQIRGHTKGVLAFDLSTNTGFWLVQSTPKFPPEDTYSFPTSGMPNAQTLLCITLADADTAKRIANQMFAAQQPNVYLASKIPVDLAAAQNDPRVLLMQNQVMPGNSPVAAVIPFDSKGGVKFMSIAKNAAWGQDFYNDLVGPALHDNLNVETWEHGKTPPSLDSDKIHTVVDMKGINLGPLGIDIEWPEPDDHAKLAISARSEATHYVCIGDMNFTLAMRKRSGGTVAFKCEALWSSISEILVGVTTHPKIGSTADKLEAFALNEKNAWKMSRRSIAAAARISNGAVTLIKGAVVPVALKAIDTSVNTNGKARQIKAEGYGAVGVYLRPDRCSLAMVRDLQQAGLKIWSLYEKGNPTQTQYFTKKQGTTDGNAASAFAEKMGQPSGTQIYATVDYDPDDDDPAGPTINGAISDYMSAFQTAVHAGGYLASVYSSGRACRILIANGLAQTGWLSVSGGFAEHEEFKPRASIVQSSVINSDWDEDTISDIDKPGFW